MWIVESSLLWGNVRSVVKTECVWSLETEIFHWRGWNLEVSPNRELVSSEDKAQTKFWEQVGGAELRFKTGLIQRSIQTINYK